MKIVTAPALAVLERAPGVSTDTIAAAQRGDSDACRRIVQAHQRSVHGLIWRMMGVRGRRHTVDDLTQEAFLRAFRSLPRFVVDGPAKFSTWLLTIASRTAIDELRRPRLVVTPLERPDGGALASTAEGPDRMSERASTGRAIARAVEGLGPEVRAACVLRAYHELTYAEISVALGIDEGTVKSRLWRARRALQAELEGVRNG